MQVRDVEHSLRRIINSAFKKGDGEIDEAARQNAVDEISSSNRVLRRKFAIALTQFIKQYGAKVILTAEFVDRAFVEFFNDVGQYVPFYFCPRSIMLYILHMGNHPDLDYSEGQRPIIHLQADMEEVVSWADHAGVRWAFSDRNAGTCLAEFFRSEADLDKINWAAVEATVFRDAEVKEGKQAEFLVFESFPWKLIEKIGVINTAVKGEVEHILEASKHRPPVKIERSWYY